FYINLDAAVQRRDFLEKNFAQHRADEWTLTRIAAIDAAHVDANGIGGSATSTQKACFLSHKKAIRESLRVEGPVLILEDDALFGENTCKIVDQLPAYGHGDKWDILFTDVIVTGDGDLVQFARLRRQVAEKTEVRILDLKNVWFAGSTAYLINGRSKSR